MIPIRSLFILLFSSAFLVHCAKEMDVEILDPVVEIQPDAEHQGKAYMILQNHTPQTKRLISVVTTRAEKVELFTTPISANEQQAIKLDQIKIPPMGRTELERNGDFIKLSNLSANLSPGEPISLTLQFADGSIQAVEAIVTQSPKG